MDQVPRYDPISLDAPALCCLRGGVEIFDGLDLSCGPGSAIVLKGRNGAGKSSALLTLAGHIPQNRKSFQWIGLDPDQSPAALMHFLGHLPAIQNGLTVHENLAFWCTVHGGDPGRIEAALKAASLDSIAQLPCETLSAGQTRRLALARLIAIPRPVWLLDEPTATLDSQGADWVGSLILSHLGSGGMAVIASHLEIGIETDPRVREVVLDGADAP